MNPGTVVAVQVDMLRLELRLALECKVCQQLIEPVPEALRPRDALTGRVRVDACMAMGICPACFTELDWPFDWEKIIKRYVCRMNKRHNRKKK